MKVRRRTTFTAVGVAVALVAVQVASGSAGAEIPEPPGPLEIGTVLPLTGPLAFFGPSMVAATELAVEDINAAGGVFGQPVELAQGDSGTDFVVANATVDGYLADDTQVIVGAVSSRALLRWRIGCRP
jgi:ABC-type branched-subunit amino acid transport system substrate-binding protein